MSIWHLGSSRPPDDPAIALHLLHVHLFAGRTARTLGAGALDVERDCDLADFFELERDRQLVTLLERELSPNFGDGPAGQAAAVLGLRSVDLAMTSIPLLNVTPRTSFGNWL